MRKALKKAIRFLEDELVEGPCRLVTLIARAEKEGLSRRRLFEAALFLGVHRHTEGFGPEKRSTWSLKPSVVRFHRRRRVTLHSTYGRLISDLTDRRDGCGDKAEQEALASIIKTLALAKKNIV